MLKLSGIKKIYKVADSEVHALRGIDLAFRKNEFVCVLGPSGCGKTTMLNIIGGLDQYSDGDLMIQGKSTKAFSDHDWDVYRNHRIGFIFQSYNLIPHQTVLGNVELALTIAGIGKEERRKRAANALERVGLGAELHKRPNQLSGGQMQRVAIARALVNDPDILLADEPTGALDSETSVQIMDLIKEISGERLVIMVTHNPELAESYASRIVRLQDGKVIADSNPYDGEDATVSENSAQQQTETVAEKGEKTKRGRKKEKKPRASMSFFTSLALSARNLLTKKGRTIVTSIAGSIGIISVCLVLALSNGFNDYIKRTQEDMLSSSPLTITETTLDVTAIMAGMNSASDLPDLSKIGDNVYVNSFLTNMAQGMTVENDLSEEYLKYISEDLNEELYETIAYGTGLKLDNSLYTTVTIEDGGQTILSLSELKAYYTDKLSRQDEKYASLAQLVEYLGSVYGKMPGTSDVNSAEFGKYVLSQYDVIDGTFPTSANEAVLVIGSNNDVTDLTLAQLGFINEADFLALFQPDSEGKPISFESIKNQKFALNYNDAIYEKVESGNYLYEYDRDRTQLDLGAEKGEVITVSGILRLKEGLNYGCLGKSGLFLTEQMSNQLIQNNLNSAIVQTLKAQMEGQRAVIEQYAQLAKEVQTQISALDKTSPDYMTQVALLSGQLSAFLSANRDYLTCVAPTMEEYYITSSSSMQGASSIPAGVAVIYGDSALRHLGGTDKVNSISIYTSTFEAKDGVVAHLDAWNEKYSDDTAKQVKYTDTIGVMMSMVETMLNAVTYVLVAFTAISLVVSSVMIGIITYVSVVERVKEIGVLRSLGARKRDIRNLFNAETFIIGLASGLIGVCVTYLLSLIVNLILGALTGISTLASLPITSAIIMVAISVLLTLISGLIPANAAAKKDPVIALRTE